MERLIYVLLVINAGLIIFFALIFERLFTIMKANSLTELMKYKQQQKKGFVEEKEEEEFYP